MYKKNEFLKSQKILRIATISGNTPHVVPVWYMYSDKKIYIGTNTKSKKAINIKTNKNVSFCIDVGINAPDIYGIMGQGEANLIIEKILVKKIAKKILLKYFTNMQNKSAKELLDETDCIIKIESIKFSIWKY